MIINYSRHIAKIHVLSNSITLLGTNLRQNEFQVKTSVWYYLFDGTFTSMENNIKTGLNYTRRDACLK